MCPQGAVHVPFKYAVKVCKRLQIDYAEAVVDFEFGNRMAVPVIQGVVIAEEHHDQVMEELEKDEAERARKEDEKRRKAALGKWRKFLMGMRIVERIRQDYGEIDDKVSVFGHSSVNPLEDDQPPGKLEEEDMAGGFLPEGYEEEKEEEEAEQTSSFFPVTNDEDNEAHDDDLVMEDHQGQPEPKAYHEPEPKPEPLKDEPEAASSSSTKAQQAPKSRGQKRKQASPPLSTEPAKGTRRSGRQTRQRVVIDDSGDSGDDDDAYEDIDGASD
jgi:xeroderma pigmentosum group C-complementing protein